MDPISAPRSDLAGLLGDRLIVLLGCGKMGGAMAEGWVAAGVPGGSVRAVDPTPTAEAQALTERLGLRLAADLAGALDGAPAEQVAALVVAVKPQMMDAALPQAAMLGGGDTVALSIAAGTPISRFEAALGAGTPVVRAMPNTPAAIGKGVSGLVAGAFAGPAHRALAEGMASAVGETLWLEAESDLDALTAVSGSGPAYVFHMIEALAAAGVAEGLPEELAMRLARATVTGAGALAERSEKSAAQLRIDVTSPAGTTAAGLGALMAEGDGLTPLMTRTVAAAAARSRELGK